MDGTETGIIISITVFLVLCLCFGAYQRGAANTRNNSRVEGRTAEIDRIHTELGDEQRTNKERLDRIYQLTEGTDALIGKLRESNRRSGDLFAVLEQEVDVLENYINSVQRELAGYRGDNTDSGTALEIAE
jgi:hypothetical protein